MTILAAFRNGKHWTVIVQTTNGAIHAMARTEAAALALADGITNGTINNAAARRAAYIPWEETS